MRASTLQRLPLRVRLTLWYSLVFAVAFFAVGTTCLWMVHRTVVELQDNELQQRVRSVRRFLEARPINEPPAQTRAAIAAAYDVMHGSKWLQVIDDHGVWLYRSTHIAAAYPRLALPQELAAPATYFDFVAEGLHAHALIAPIQVHGVRYTVQTGLSLTKTLIVLSSFRLQLWLLTALALAFSSLAGYLMSRKALTPIALLAAEARRINETNLAARMPALPSRDELAALSVTLNKMLERIEAGYRSVRSFTANAAHELRTPVALLRAEAEVALAFPRDADYYRRTCEQVVTHAAEMATLIDQLLALARTDAGVETYRFAALDLADLLSQAYARWQRRFAEAGLHFELHPLPETSPTPVWVEGDEPALLRLLDVLIENAWRYTPAGRSVTLSVKRKPDSARVSVADTGDGIPIEAQATLFDRFVRVSRPLRGDFSGSGLGLVLAQGIAQAHDATIVLHSLPGHGADFSLELRTVPAPSFAATSLAPSPAGNTVSDTAAALPAIH